MKRKIVELTVLSAMLITTLTACANVTINTGNAPASQSSAADTGSNETTGSAATDAGDGGQSADSGQTEQTTSEKAAALDFFAGLKYSADFKQAFYVEYGSEDTAKDHEGELIYIKGEAGEYDAEIGRDGITVSCKRCGASKFIPTNSLISANEFLNADSLELE